VKEGFIADLIAVSGAPGQYISKLREIVFVMEGGKVFRKDKL